MKTSELLREGNWNLKNKDGKKKSFKDKNSPEAKAWLSSSSEKKPPKVKKYSYEWWDQQDTKVKPWAKIDFIDSNELEKLLKNTVNDRAPDDWTFGRSYSTETDGVPVAARNVRLMYLYTADDDLGIGDEPVEDSQVIGIKRDVNNPEKFVFDGYK